MLESLKRSVVGIRLDVQNKKEVTRLSRLVLDIRAGIVIEECLSPADLFEVQSGLEALIDKQVAYSQWEDKLFGVFKDLDVALCHLQELASPALLFDMESVPLSDEESLELYPFLDKVQSGLESLRAYGSTGHSKYKKRFASL